MSLRKFLASALLLASASLHATTISGQLSVEVDSSSMVQFITVDFYRFSTPGGLLGVNAFGSRLAPAGPSSQGHPDIMLWLFKDDGSLGVDDLLIEEDDWTGGGPARNPALQSGLDPFLSYTAAAGDYVLAVGTCCDFGGADMINGRQSDGFPWHWGGGPTKWDYRLEIAGDISMSTVPEPSTLALSLLPVTLIPVIKRRAAMALRRNDEA